MIDMQKINQMKFILSTASTTLPQSLFVEMGFCLDKVIENFYPLAELCGFNERQSEVIADELGRLMLRKQVKHNFLRDKGSIFVRLDTNRWIMADPNFLQKTEVSEVPTEWREQLGKLQLIDTDKTFIDGCGFRFDESMFYVMGEV